MLTRIIDEDWTVMLAVFLMRDTPPFREPPFGLRPRAW